MLKPAILPGLAVLSLLGAAPARAEPVLVRADQRSALLRRDVGDGVCASVVHAQDAAGPAFSDIAEATAAINGTSRSLVIDGRFSGVFSAADFRNADNDALGDFPVNHFFPFSSDPRATPRGNGRNIAARVRGYLNIYRPGVFTNALHADDGARLSIGGVRVTVPDVNQQVADRYLRQVRYGAAGLYPVELTYYQNGSAAVLELATADSMEPEVFAPDRLDTSRFQLVTKDRLYSARAGQVAACTECSSNEGCPQGSYCARDWPGSTPDGLCAPCLVADACGAACLRCPTALPVCSKGSCVQCAQDCDCPGGQLCDTASSTCHAGAACRVDAECAAGQVCDSTYRICVPRLDCVVDAECPCGYTCDATLKRCKAQPPSCKDQACPAGLVCDTQSQTCRPPEAAYIGGCAVAQRRDARGAAPPAALGLLGLALVVRRRRSRRVRAALLGGLLCLLPWRAHAELSANTQTFQPALGPENIITVEGTRTPRALRPLANLLFEYDHRPLRLIDRPTGTLLADTVPGAVALHLMAGLGLLRWLAIGADLPVVLYQGFDAATPPQDVPRAPSPAGVGDLRLVAKARLINNERGGLGLAFVPQVTFPTGEGGQLRGLDAFGIEPRLALDYKTRGGALVALNLGFLGRTSNQGVRQMEVGSQVRYGLGVFLPLPAGLGIAAELAGGTSVSRVTEGLLYSPLEGHLGGRWTHRSGLQLNLGGGAGLTNAVGSPQARVFASIGYLPSGRASSDGPRPEVGELEVVKSGSGTGTVTSQPSGIDCGPDCIATYRVGALVNLKAIPGPDSLLIGWSGPCSGAGPCTVMIHERTRVSTEFARREEKRHALTVELSGDGTGVVKLEPGGLTCGPVCSASLRSGTPVQAVARADKDSYFTGWEGPCSGLGACAFQLRADTVLKAQFSKTRLPQSGNRIHFETAKWSIDIDSYHLLDDVVTILKEYPRMHLRIEGHTDIRPFRRPGGNLLLSRSRARAVVDYLVTHGIASQRLRSEGYGEGCPVAPNNTPDGMARNRRTEFIIVDPLSRPAPLVGCHAATRQQP